MSSGRSQSVRKNLPKAQEPTGLAATPYRFSLSSAVQFSHGWSGAAESQPKPVYHTVHRAHLTLLHDDGRAGVAALELRESVAAVGHVVASLRGGYVPLSSRG